MSIAPSNCYVNVPSNDRIRNLAEPFIMPHKGISKILKNAGPRLQIQFNDENNKCIGRSWVLKPEVKITNRDNLFQQKFVPISDSTENLRVPGNAKSILIFGQQGKFASIDSALDKLTDKLNFNPEYKPTVGIVISPNFYLITPMKLVLAGFDLENYNQTIIPFNDIIKSIEIKDGILRSVRTIEPLVVIDEH